MKTSRGKCQKEYNLRKSFNYLHKNTEISNFRNAALHNIPNLKFSLPYEMEMVVTKLWKQNL